MRTLVIDNYDSFTWNLAHYIAEVNGQEPVVVANDQYRWEELWAELGPFDNIVISPGPGSVENESDFHISRQVIQQAEVPLLGVCLGHQGIAHGYGGQIRHAAEPVHGRCSQVWHNGDPLFRNIPSPLTVVRYHSLVAAAPLAPALSAIAYTDDGQIMGLRHRQRPQWGVQFHPESILTEYGYQLIRNFRDLSHEYSGRRVFAMPAALREPSTTTMGKKQVYWQALDAELLAGCSSEDVFVALYGQDERAFWLDSALATEGLARFSFLGPAPSAAEDIQQCHIRGQDSTSITQARQLLAQLEQGLQVETQGGDGLPFEFRGGWVGFFGYEMKAVCGAQAAHDCPQPDAVWLRVERFIAWDHSQQRIYLVALAALTDEVSTVAAQTWLAQTADQLAQVRPAPAAQSLQSNQSLQWRWDQSREEYLHSIAQCKAAITDGVSYEVCLTNQLRLPLRIAVPAAQSLDLYRILRNTNPAPFAAYLRLDGWAIVSASPERFIRVEANGMIEAKPIKGTCARDADPQRDAQRAEALRCSEKDRAENLMIVDLMRNDLGRVAVQGSVSVPRLMYVESYATVHQLLSTVSAKLRPDCGLIDLIRAAFPGGSITGAPKLRTMHIIDQLERSARGVYCGSIGYLGYNRVADLNIAIRTVVVDEQGISLGAGGAITQLSDANDEFAEIVLKAGALVRAISLYVHGREVDYLSGFLNADPHLHGMHQGSDNDTATTVATVLAPRDGTAREAWAKSGYAAG